MTDARRRIPILVVLPPRVLLLDLAGPLEVLRVADTIQDLVSFVVTFAAPQVVTRSSIGLQLIGVGPLPKTIEAGTVILVPGSTHRPWGEAEDAETNIQMEAAIVDWLRDTVQSGHQLVTVCEGALLAARAGLLDGYACTTHHASCAQLAKTAPSARVLENRLFVEDRDRLTSAGVTAGVDLMLHLVATWAGPTTALATARALVVYMRRGPNDPQLSPWLEGRSHLHPVVHRAQDAIIADPARHWSMTELGRITGASPRNLSRLFLMHTGMSASDVVNRARVALARELIEQTDVSIERVAQQAGFGSTRHMRRVWNKFHSITPMQSRKSISSRFGHAQTSIDPVNLRSVDAENPHIVGRS
jgi:transcriptional regulator GlxA family with amidase domain